jgi:hypothetical protein
VTPASSVAVLPTPQLLERHECPCGVRDGLGHLAVAVDGDCALGLRIALTMRRALLVLTHDSWPERQDGRHVR